MSNADEFLEMARSDPQRVLVDGASYLGRLDPGEHEEQAITLRALSLAARNTNRIVDSIDYARRGSAAAREGGFEKVALLATLTETGSMAISGDLEGALEIIQGVLAGIDDHELAAEFEYQKAAVLAGMGHLTEAIEGFQRLLPVYESLADTESIMFTLNQLGRLLTSTGDLAQAGEFLERSLELARQDNDLARIPGILHNLGLLASYQGDIPSALAMLQESDVLYMAVSGADAPQHVARCEVLISVGLYEEALATSKTIARSSAERHDVEHELNALIVAARAAVLAERYDEAIDLADRAVQAVGKADDPPILYEAKVIGIEARLEKVGPSHQLLDTAIAIADELAIEGMTLTSEQARWLAVRISNEIGDDEKTAELASQVAAAATGPIELRLQGPLARALLAVLEGERGRALRSVRSGLAMIDRFQESLGATDLRLGIEKRGHELGDVGLRLVLESRRPRQVLEWLDRTRARALRLHPVTPVEDASMRALLADLRRVGAELRQPDQRTNATLESRRRSLQTQILALKRAQRGGRTDRSSFSVDSLVDTLGEGALYEIGMVDGRMFAIHVENRRARMIELGNFNEARRDMDQLRFAMRRASRRGRPVGQSTIERAASHLFDRAGFDSEHMVVIPPPELMALPWGAFAPLRGHSLVVAPSAQIWWRARRADSRPGGVVVAGGPDLDHADEEVDRIGVIHTGSTRLRTGSTVDQVREAVEGAGIAHIACHATFSYENPMFSSLRLADGDLNVYDIERLRQAPEVVVLSACDSGYTETRAGDELAGLTSALLSMGTKSVIASVGLVPDSAATSDLMVDLHKGLVAGHSPSEALAAAQAKAFQDPGRFVSAASFVCVGA